MNHIRQETEAEYSTVGALLAAAFRDDPQSDQTEPQLVARLRRSAAFSSELSLVAERDAQVLGHILLTKVHIVNGEQRTMVLSLAPVSVLPDFQRQGIGTALIERAHVIATELGYSVVVLLGHADYYPRFGYEVSEQYGIRFPFEVPAIYCMAKALKPGALEGIPGLIEYPPAFFDPMHEV
ncbi:MAG: N-acetyltransferase [Phaeodactylibacter sp.]|nr:N-acetyltransferase [Phaeodactylibacter sp.]